MAATESIAHVLGGINNQITDEYGSDNDMEVTGGGRGWTATTTIDGTEVSAKGTSKVDAAEALLAEAKRLSLLNLDLTDEDMTEAEFEQCVAECVGSIRPYCECKCGGQNHGAAHGAAAPTLIGKKECACGCGEITQRRFVPGHDARYHARIALREWAAENGVTGSEEELRKAKAAALRKAARTRRAAKRAEVKANEAKVAKKAEEVAKTIQPKRPTAKVLATRAKQAKQTADQLPF